LTFQLTDAGEPALELRDNMSATLVPRVADPDERLRVAV